MGSLVCSLFCTSHVLLTPSEGTPQEPLYFLALYHLVFPREASARVQPPQPTGPRRGGSKGGELGGQEMDGVKTSVCVSNGEWGRTMLRVLLCRGWKRRDVLPPPPQEPSGEVVGGGFLKATPRCLHRSRMHSCGGECWFWICHSVAVGVLGGLPDLEPAAPCCGSCWVRQEGRVAAGGGLEPHGHSSGAPLSP